MSPATATETTMLDVALKYLKRGWSVIPVGTNKRPLVNWKRYQRNHATAQEVRDWIEDNQNTSIAIITGTVSGIVVLDVDVKNGGRESFEQLQQEHGRLPQTVTVKTGGGGRHFYFQHPGMSVRPSAGRLGPGLDIRGDGGYVVAPPSQHESGTLYEWKHGPETMTVAPLPEWLLRLIVDDPKSERHSNATAIVEGQRNATLTSLAGTMRRRGFGLEAILQALLAENDERCQPPLSAEEVERTAQSIARYEPETADAADDPGGERYTDMANAGRLADEAAGRIAHVEEMKNKWYVYDGVRLNLEAKTALVPYVKAIARRLYGEAAELETEAQRAEDAITKSSATSARGRWLRRRRRLRRSGSARRSGTWAPTVWRAGMAVTRRLSSQRLSRVSG
jgi:hypothetical protein